MSAEGGATLPGLINARTHVPMTLFRGVVDGQILLLDGELLTLSPDEILAEARAFRDRLMADGVAADP